MRTHGWRVLWAAALCLAGCAGSAPAPGQPPGAPPPAAEPPGCVPGSQLVCSCAAGTSGFQLCEPEGKSLGACECTGQPPPPPTQTTCDAVQVPFSVVDAAYSAALDAVVVASTRPNAVQIIGSDLRPRAIPLAGPPMAIRTTPGGRDALVGHQTFVSHVDLVNGRVLAVHQVPAAALQFVVPGNDVAYLFPFDHRFNFVVALHLPSGTLARGPDKHYRLAVRHAPSLGAIYGATLGVSPANLVRYDLDGMAISPGTKSSSGRDHPIGDNLWLDAPGQRIVTERGSVFRALPGRTPDDMTYLGDIALEPIDRFPRIQHFHHSAEFRKALVIQKNSKWEDDHVTDTRLRVYEGEFFQLTELRAMPCLQAGATRFPLHGRFAIAFRSVRRALLLSQLQGPATAQDWTMALTPL